MVFSKKTSQNKLFFFTLSVNTKDVILSHTIDWVEAFTSNFDTSEIIATRIAGQIDSQTIHYHQLGGGSALKKIKALIKLVMIFGKILSNRKNSYVFYHMTTSPMAFLSIPLRLINVPQGLWYSHSVPDFGVRFFSRFCNIIVAPTRDCFPVPNSKLLAVGHCINFSKLTEHSTEVSTQKYEGILCIGRIARIKKIEVLISALGEIKNPSLKNVYLAGPITEPAYLEELRELAAENSVNLNLLGAIAREEFPIIVKRFSFAYSGTPKSVDKGILEAAFLKAVVISENNSVLELTGMKRFWERQGYTNLPNISQQLEFLLALKREEIDFLGMSLSVKTSELNNLQDNISLISRTLVKARS